MESTIISNARVFSEELADLHSIGSLLSDVNIPYEEQLNFIALFTAANGAELQLEFQCSDSAKARDHVDGLIYFFKKDLHFLWISGERWNAQPDVLKRVLIKRKIEFGFVEFELEHERTPFFESYVNEDSAVMA